MIKNFLFLIIIFVVLITNFCAVHYLIIKHFNFIENPLIVPKIYLTIGLITLMIFQIGCFVKIKFPDYVGFAFIAGMIIKMAVVLAMVIVNQETKTNIIQLIISYFVILVCEVFVFIKLINLKLKKH